MATHSSTAWKIPWTEEPGGLQSMKSQELDTTQQLNHHHTLRYLSIIIFAVLGLHCCAGFSLVAVSKGYPLVAVCGLLVAVTSLVAEHRFEARGLQWLQHMGLVIVAHGFSYSTARGLFLDRGLNPCPLHWQTDSHPLCHQGSPILSSFKFSDS